MAPQGQEFATPTWSLHYPGRPQAWEKSSVCSSVPEPAAQNLTSHFVLPTQTPAQGYRGNDTDPLLQEPESANELLRQPSGPRVLH